MNYIGIDISKGSFDVAMEKGNRFQQFKFSNDRAGFVQLENLLRKAGECWCVMEASGPYYLKLAWYLQQKNIPLSVVNPLVIRRFCQMRMVRAKTDKKDAAMICQYGKTEKPKAWLAKSSEMMELQQMQAYIDLLEKSIIAFNNQLEAIEQSPVMSKQTRVGITKMIKAAQKQVEVTEARMQVLIENQFGQAMTQLTSIPGIGKKTSRLLILATEGFNGFENVKQVSSYLGLSPRIYDSGTSVKGKRRICKMGMSRIRAMLYVCSWSAIKCNKACRELYARLVEKGKAKMVALIAVANKLIKQAFAIVTKGLVYEENFSPKACL